MTAVGRGASRWATLPVALIAVIAAGALVPSAASAGGLPHMFTVTRTGQTVFQVRPHDVVTDSADGGDLIIHWARWTATGAAGSGTSHPDHGSTPIRVKASRVIDGYFTRLTVWFKRGSSWQRDRLGLGYLGGISLAWINLAWMFNPQSGSTPWPA